MLEILLKYLQANLQASFPDILQVYGLAEIVNEDAQSYPAVYCTKDEYKKVGELENYLYFRQNGQVTEAESEEEAVSGCDFYVTRTYPMVAVAYVPKNVFHTDNAYIDDKVSNNIANIIRLANWGSVVSAVKADTIYAEITNINTDRKDVWGQEYKNIPMAARLDHVYCAVEFDLVVSASESCLRNFDCNDDQVIIDGNTIIIIIKCSNPMPEIFDVENVTTTITDARLKGGSLEKIFLFMGGTEQVSINNVSNYDPVTGTITFAYDLGGQTVKVQYFPNP